MSFLKTVPVPDRGVNYAVKPHAIDPRFWFNLDGFKTKQGTIRSLEGWSSVVSAPLGTSIHGIFELFVPDVMERHFAVLTANKFYEYDLDTHVLTDRTGAAILAANHADPWTGTVFNGTLYVTSLLNEGSYKWLGTGNISLVPNMPAFAALNTLNSYLCGFHQCDTDAHHPYTFRWASEGTDDQWTATQNIDAGQFDIDDTPDKGVALVRLGNDLVAYKERTLVPITFIGGNEVFGRRAAVTGAGLISPYGLIASGDKHIFMGQETFYAYSGGNVVDDSIGDPIRNKVYEELRLPPCEQIRAVYLRERQEAAWFYPSKFSTTEGCDRVVIFNMKDGAWYGPMHIIDYITFASNFSVTDPTRMNVFGSRLGYVYGFTASYTENGILRTLRAESGDHNLQTDMVDENGQRLFFPLSTVFQINILNIDVEAAATPQTARIYIGSRLDLSDDIVWRGPYVITFDKTQTIRVPVRSTGRWFRLRLETEATDDVAVLGYQFEFERVGNR